MIALLEVASVAAAVAFATDPAGAPCGTARWAGSVSRLRPVDDINAAGTIPRLPKG